MTLESVCVCVCVCVCACAIIAAVSWGGDEGDYWKNQ